MSGVKLAWKGLPSAIAMTDAIETRAQTMRDLIEVFILNLSLWVDGLYKKSAELTDLFTI